MAHAKNKALILTIAGAAAAFAAYYKFLRPRHSSWGATQLEVDDYYAGDELVPNAIHNATHAITIDAPPEMVWPWFVQLGQDKGGFYSYTALENLLGCEMKNAQEIHPEWQNLKLGDSVMFHPKAPAQPILILEERRHMVIGQVNDFVWGFHLTPLPYAKTRLVVRALSRRKSLFARAFDIAFWEPAHFVMERKMMLTIKGLAEEMYQTKLFERTKEAVSVI